MLVFCYSLDGGSAEWSSYVSVLPAHQFWEAPHETS